MTLRGAEGRFVVSAVLEVWVSVGAIQDADETLCGLKGGLNGALDVLADLGRQNRTGGRQGGAGSAGLPGRKVTTFDTDQAPQA